jgi:CSLREA domain-containing protein
MITAAACVAPPGQPAHSADQGPPSQAAAAAGLQCRHEFTVTTTQDRATVCKLGDCSLREAVMAANACPGRNLINVPAGRYKLTLGHDLEITEEVTIIGAGRDTTVVEDVSGGGAFAVQHGGGIDHLSVIREITVENSKTVPCVVVGRQVPFGTPPPETVLLLTEARLQNCGSRGHGGGMRIFKGGYAWLIDVNVFGNHALLGGGIANTEGKLEVWQSRFSNNAGNQGGAIYSQGPYSPPLPTTSDDRVIIRDSNFSNNSAVKGSGYMAQGGALHVEWHAVRVTKTRFELNEADDWGGAISLMGVGPATLENVEM